MLEIKRLAMRRIDKIKQMDVEKAGRYICGFIDDCNYCPWNHKCGDGVNGVVEFLKEEEKDKDGE